MEITKLTITPINTFCKGFVSYKPSKEIASTLIKEKISRHNSYDYNKIPRAMKKLPKHLQGWINPNSKVIANQGINLFM